MKGLTERLKAARDEVAALERQVGAATCGEVGHRWVSLGGCNAGCHKDCCCSVPVHECSYCKDCDYGDNREADDIRARCLETHGPFEDEAGRDAIRALEKRT